MVEIWGHLLAYLDSDDTLQVSSSQPRTNHLGVKVFHPLVVVSVEVQVERELKFRRQKEGETKEVSSTFEEFVRVQFLPLSIPIFQG